MARRAEWEEQVREWQSSGMTAAAFCADRELNPKLLHWWSSYLAREARKRGETERSNAVPTVKMARVVASPARAVSRPVVVEIGSARVVVSRETDRAALEMVMELLRVNR